jgi:DNA-binding phage protein
MAAANPEPLELRDEDSLFWQDFNRDMQDVAFRRRYLLDAARVAQLDETLALLDAAREEAGVSKADLARHIQTNAVSVRRLLTSSPGNPTFATITKVATALGFRLRVEPIPEEELDDAPVLPAVRELRQHHTEAGSKAPSR